MDFRVVWFVALALVVSACSSSSPRPDGGVDAASLCEAACDDGQYCNGVETCDPGNQDADADGCVAGTAPCAVGCDESADSCPADCEVPDRDGDGHDAVACGGADCDDDDAGAFPGNLEACDEEGRDEDCDPVTLGPDADGDNHYPEDCCNGASCGGDCDDDRPGVNPSAVDGCGGGDEDCDGDIDEEPDSTYFRDQDSDDWGDDAETLASCSQPMNYVPRGGDCSDDPFAESNAQLRNPGETEICNLIDDNCDGEVDEGLECDCTVPDMVRPCGFDPALDDIGICRLGSQTCRAEGSYTTCSGHTPPIPELCNLADDDCDTVVDEGARTRCWADPDRDGYAAADAGYTDECACPDATTSADPANGADCAPNDVAIHPGAIEICNRVDDDCSRAGAPELGEDADSDGHTATGYATCTGGFPKDDCLDSEARVRPGAFYDRVPYCPAGTCACGGGGCANQTLGACPISCTTGAGPVPRSYDFNCDGQAIREPSESGTCSTSCGPGFSCREGFPNYAGSPACGSNVTYYDCGGDDCACTQFVTSRGLRCY